MSEEQSAERIVRIVQTVRPFEYRSPFPGEENTLLICVLDDTVSNEERIHMCRQIVASKCRYACCWGTLCSHWDDSIDWSYIETDPTGDPPDETFIMTTWHDDKSLEEAMEYWWLWTSFGNYISTRLAVFIIGEDPDFRQRLENGVESVRQGPAPGEW